MAFSTTITRTTLMGNRRVVYGTYTNSTAGDTGGDVITSLQRVEDFQMTVTGAAVASAPSANESFPLSSGTVTIVADSNTNGLWKAIGR